MDRVQEEAQLEVSGLTDQDLERIECAFADVLFAIHHRRDGYREGDVTPSRVRVTASGDTVHSPGARHDPRST